MGSSGGVGFYRSRWVGYIEVGGVYCSRCDVLQWTGVFIQWVGSIAVDDGWCIFWVLQWVRCY